MLDAVSLAFRSRVEESLQFLMISTKNTVSWTRLTVYTTHGILPENHPFFFSLDSGSGPGGFAEPGEGMYCVCWFRQSSGLALILDLGLRGMESE